MVDDQGQHGGVERRIVEPVQGPAEVVRAEGRGRRDPPGRQPNHGGAGVEAHDLGAMSHELGGVEAGAAAGVEDAHPGHVAEQVEHGRPVVEGVVGAVLGVAGIVPGEGLEAQVASTPPPTGSIPRSR